MSKLRNVVVICTRNRPDHVSRLIENLAKQTLRPELVLIIDGSDEPKTLTSGSTHREGISGLSQHLQIEVIAAAPGLPKQRNIALDALSGRAEVVHFFDDDVEIDPSYLEFIWEAFSAEQNLVGASGDVINAHPARPSVVQRILLLKSRKGGVVLSSGVNIGVPGQKQSKAIMWLPGCAMSYRLDAIADLKFDEARSGYALGEDVDFSARAGLVGPLRYVEKAKLMHNFAMSNRLSANDLARDDVISRWKLATRLPYVNRMAVAYATLGHALLYYLTSFGSGHGWQIGAANTRLKTLWTLVTSSQG